MSQYEDGKNQSNRGVGFKTLTSDMPEGSTLRARYDEFIFLKSYTGGTSQDVGVVMDKQAALKSIAVLGQRLGGPNADTTDLVQLEKKAYKSCAVWGEVLLRAACNPRDGESYIDPSNFLLRMPWSKLEDSTEVGLTTGALAIAIYAPAVAWDGVRDYPAFRVAGSNASVSLNELMSPDGPLKGNFLSRDELIERLDGEIAAAGAVGIESPLNSTELLRSIAAPEFNLAEAEIFSNLVKYMLPGGPNKRGQYGMLEARPTSRELYDRYESEQLLSHDQFKRAIARALCLEAKAAGSMDPVSQAISITERRLEEGRARCKRLCAFGAPGAVLISEQERVKRNEYLQQALKRFARDLREESEIK